METSPITSSPIDSSSSSSSTDIELNSKLDQSDRSKTEKFRLAIDEFLSQLKSNFEFSSSRPSLSLNESEFIQKTKSDIFSEYLAMMSRSKTSSIINCGILKNSIREYFHYSPFFKKEIEIYSAEIDEENQILYRASSLAEKLKCARSLIGMYLKRTIQYSRGIFQATAFKFKRSKINGLKAGGYFLTLEVCEEFEKLYMKKNKKREMENFNNNAAGNNKNKKIKISNENNNIYQNGSIEQNTNIITSNNINSINNNNINQNTKTSENPTEIISSTVSDCFDQNYSTAALENSSMIISLHNTNSNPSTYTNVSSHRISSSNPNMNSYFNYNFGSISSSNSYYSSNSNFTSNCNSPPPLMPSSTPEPDSFSCSETFNSSEFDCKSHCESEIIRANNIDNQQFNIKTEFDSFIEENNYFIKQEKSRTEFSSLDLKEFFYLN